MQSQRDDISQPLRRLSRAAQAIGHAVTFMEVCGTHTMSAFRSGLHSLMPDKVTLLSGPGCPVCVTAQGDIDLLTELAIRHDLTLCTYGDMMRVPGRCGSLEAARTGGADIRVVYSTMDAVRIAWTEPDRQVVFGAVGFETTAPATAAAVIHARRQGLVNFSALASHKRVVPAMLALLSGATGQTPQVDGFLCPGHVSVIIGSQAYLPIVQQYRVPCVIGGFEPVHMTLALAAITELVRDGQPALVNQYPQAVTAAGNTAALACIDEVFEPADVRWRGLGVIPDSGLAFRNSYAEFDAAKRFGLHTPDDHEPRGCICGQVIAGCSLPTECTLFGKACTPVRPIGPCMVSSEGTCQAYFKYGRARWTGQSPLQTTGDRLLKETVP